MFYVDLILTTLETGGAGTLATSRRSYTQLSGRTGIQTPAALVPKPTLRHLTVYTYKGALSRQGIG